MLEHVSQLANDKSCERSSLVTFYDSHNVRSIGLASHGGRGAHGGCETKGDRTQDRKSHKSTHCGYSNQLIDYSLDLQCRPSESTNQAICQDIASICSRSGPPWDSNMITIPTDDCAQLLPHTQALSSSTATLV